MTTIQDQLTKNNLNLINLIICTANDRILLEKFVIEIESTNFNSRTSGDTCDDSWIEAFRICLLKICYFDSILFTLPKGCELTFFITIKLFNEGIVSGGDKIGVNFPWYQMDSVIDKQPFKNTEIIPIKSILVGNEYKFQLYVNEMKENKKRIK